MECGESRQGRMNMKKLLLTGIAGISECEGDQANAICRTATSRKATMIAVHAAQDGARYERQSRHLCPIAINRKAAGALNDCGTERVLVLLQLLGGQQRVELARNAIEAIQ